MRQLSPCVFVFFWHQSEARTAATVWNWSGKTLSPGALLAVLYFSSCHIFPPVQTFPRPHYLPLDLRGRIFLGEKVIFITSKHGTTILFSHNNLILRKHIIVMTSVWGFLTLGSFTLGLHYINFRPSTTPRKGRKLIVKYNSRVLMIEPYFFRGVYSRYGYIRI